MLEGISILISFQLTKCLTAEESCLGFPSSRRGVPVAIATSGLKDIVLESELVDGKWRPNNHHDFDLDHLL